MEEFVPKHLSQISGNLGLSSMIAPADHQSGSNDATFLINHLVTTRKKDYSESLHFSQSLTLHKKNFSRSIQKVRVKDDYPKAFHTACEHHYVNILGKVFFGWIKYIYHARLKRSRQPRKESSLTDCLDTEELRKLETQREIETETSHLKIAEITSTHSNSKIVSKHPTARDEYTESLYEEEYKIIVKYWKRWWRLYSYRRSSQSVSRFRMFSPQENQSLNYAVLGSSFHHKQLMVKGFASFAIYLKKNRLEAYKFAKIQRLHQHRVKLANFYFWQTKFNSIREKRHYLFKSLNFWQKQCYHKQVTYYGRVFKRLHIYAKMRKELKLKAVKKFSENAIATSFVYRNVLLAKGINHPVSSSAEELYLLKSATSATDGNIMIRGYMSYTKEVKRLLFRNWKKRIDIFKKFKQRTLLQPSLAIYFNAMKKYRESQKRKRNNSNLASIWSGKRLLKKFFMRVRQNCLYRRRTEGARLTTILFHNRNLKLHFLRKWRDELNKSISLKTKQLLVYEVVSQKQLQMSFRALKTNLANKIEKKQKKQLAKRFLDSNLKQRFFKSLFFYSEFKSQRRILERAKIEKIEVYSVRKFMRIWRNEYRRFRRAKMLNQDCLLRKGLEGIKKYREFVKLKRSMYQMCYEKRQTWLLQAFMKQLRQNADSNRLYNNLTRMFQRNKQNTLVKISFRGWKEYLIYKSMFQNMKKQSDLKFRYKTCLRIFTKWSQWIQKKSALRELESLQKPQKEKELIRKYFNEFYYRFRQRVILKHNFNHFGMTRLFNMQARHFIAWLQLLRVEQSKYYKADFQYVAKNLRKLFSGWKFIAMQKVRLVRGFQVFISNAYVRLLNKAYRGWKIHYFSIIEKHREKRALRLYFLEKTLRKCFSALRKRGLIRAASKYVKLILARKTKYRYLEQWVQRAQQSAFRRKYLDQLSSKLMINTFYPWLQETRNRVRFKQRGEIAECRYNFNLLSHGFRALKMHTDEQISKRYQKSLALEFFTKTAFSRIFQELKEYYQERRAKRERLNLFMLKRAKNYIISFFNVLISKIEKKRYFNRLYYPLRNYTELKTKKSHFRSWILLFEKEKYFRRSAIRIQEKQNFRIATMAFQSLNMYLVHKRERSAAFEMVSAFFKELQYKKIYRILKERYLLKRSLKAKQHRVQHKQHRKTKQLMLNFMIALYNESIHQTKLRVVADKFFSEKKKRETLSLLSSLKDLNTAAADIRRSLKLYNDFRLVRLALNKWKEGLNNQMMSGLKKEIATTYRKRKLVQRWAAYTMRKVAEKEKIAKVQKILGLTKKESLFKVWNQYTSLEKSKKQLVSTFRNIKMQQLKKSVYEGLKTYKINHMAQKEYLKVKQGVIERRTLVKFIKKWCAALVESRVEKAKLRSAIQLLRPRKLQYYFDTLAYGVEIIRQKKELRESAAKVREKKLKANSFYILQIHKDTEITLRSAFSSFNQWKSKFLKGSCFEVLRSYAAEKCRERKKTQVARKMNGLKLKEKVIKELRQNSKLMRIQAQIQRNAQKNTKNRLFKRMRKIFLRAHKIDNAFFKIHEAFVSFYAHRLIESLKFRNRVFLGLQKLRKISIIFRKAECFTRLSDNRLRGSAFSKLNKIREKLVKIEGLQSLHHYSILTRAFQQNETKIKKKRVVRIKSRVFSILDQYSIRSRKGKLLKKHCSTLQKRRTITKFMKLWIFNFKMQSETLKLEKLMNTKFQREMFSKLINNKSMKHGLSLMITIDSALKAKGFFKYWKKATFQILNLTREVYSFKLLAKAFQSIYAFKFEDKENSQKFINSYEQGMSQVSRVGDFLTPRIQSYDLSPNSSFFGKDADSKQSFLKTQPLSSNRILQDSLVYSQKTCEPSFLTAIFEKASSEEEEDYSGEMSTAYCIYIYNLMRRCLVGIKNAKKNQENYDDPQKANYADIHFKNMFKLRIFTRLKTYLGERKLNREIADVVTLNHFLSMRQSYFFRWRRNFLFQIGLKRILQKAVVQREEKQVFEQFSQTLEIDDLACSEAQFSYMKFRAFLNWKREAALEAKSIVIANRSTLTKKTKVLTALHHNLYFMRKQKILREKVATNRISVGFSEWRKLFIAKRHYKSNLSQRLLSQWDSFVKKEQNKKQAVLNMSSLQKQLALRYFFDSFRSFKPPFSQTLNLTLSQVKKVSPEPVQETQIPLFSSQMMQTRFQEGSKVLEKLILTKIFDQFHRGGIHTYCIKKSQELRNNILKFKSFQALKHFLMNAKQQVIQFHDAINDRVKEQIFSSWRHWSSKSIKQRLEESLKEETISSKRVKREASFILRAWKESAQNQEKLRILFRSKSSHLKKKYLNAWRIYLSLQRTKSRIDQKIWYLYKEIKTKHIFSAWKRKTFAGRLWLQDSQSFMLSSSSGDKSRTFTPQIESYTEPKYLSYQRNAKWDKNQTPGVLKKIENRIQKGSSEMRLKSIWQNRSTKKSPAEKRNLQFSKYSPESNSNKLLYKTKLKNGTPQFQGAARINFKEFN